MSLQELTVWLWISTANGIGISLILPFIYKFGMERGRYILMAIVMIPFIVFILGAEAGVSMSVPTLGDAVQFLNSYPWILAVLAVYLH